MFFALVAAHVVTDFALQPDWMAAAKRTNLWVLLLHILVSGLGALAVAWLYGPRLLGPAIALTGIHLIIDWSKMRLDSRLNLGVMTPFLADQAAHILSIAAVLALFGLIDWNALLAPLQLVANHQDQALRLAFAYGISIFFGYVLIKVLAISLSVDSAAVAGSQHKYIGMLERGLITTFVALGQFLLIAVVIAPRLIYEGISRRETAAIGWFSLEMLLNIALATAAGLILLNL